MSPLTALLNAKAVVLLLSIGNGGTLPYTGVGTFCNIRFRTYTVTDGGLSRSARYTVAAGTISAPSKPSGISGPSSVKKNQAGIIFSVNSPNSSYVYLWTVPSGAVITCGQNILHYSNMGISSGSVTVKAQTVAEPPQAFSNPSLLPRCLTCKWPTAAA